MANPMEYIKQLGAGAVGLAIEHPRIALGSGLVAGLAVAHAVVGGGEISPTVTVYHDPTPTTPGLLARTRTPTAVKSATREPTKTSTVESRKSASVTFDGVTYTTTPSDQNAACSTNQVPKYLMTEQQLRQFGLSRPDVVFMKRGQGQNNSKLAWYCSSNGKRIIK